MKSHPDARPTLFSALSRQRLIQYFFFGVFLLLLLEVLHILHPFYVALFGSAILALLAYPMHAWVLRRMKGYPSIAAACSTTLIVLIIVLPVLLSVWIFIRQTAKIYPLLRQRVGTTQSLRERQLSADLPPSLAPTWEMFSDLAEEFNIDPKEILLSNVDELSKSMTHMAANLVKNTAFVLFNLGVLIFILFFFLRDGPNMINHLTQLIPMAAEHKHAILERLQITLTAVIRGVLVVALVQGFMAGIGYALFGVAFPVQLGVLTVLLSPIPIVGAIGIWVLVVLGLIMNADYHKALLVFLWNAGVVGLIDHFLRPILISAEAKIPMLLLFFGMLGGLHLYGFIGLFLGPVVIALFLAFINIYRREYQWLLSAPQKED